MSTSDFSDIDEMSGFDDFDMGYDMEEPVDDRSPVAKVTGGALSEALSSDNRAKMAKTLVDNSLPEGYKEAATSAKDSAAFARDLYDKTVDDLKGPIDELKTVAHDAVENAGFIPEALKKKLMKWTEVESREASAEQSVAATREASITSQIESMFGSYKPAPASGPAAVEGEVEEAKGKVADAKFKVESELALGTKALMQKLVDYNDQVNYNFQRKSFEIQQRMLFTSQDMLAKSTAYYGETASSLKAILKNTGLPEFVKIKSNEAYAQTIRDRFVGNVADKAGDYFSNYGNKFKENVSEKVTQYKENAIEGIEGLTDALSMLGEMGGEEGGPDPAEMVGQMAGAAGTNFLVKQFANKILKPQLEKNENVVAMGQQFKYLSNNPQELYEWALRKAKGALGDNWVTEQLEELKPTFNVDAESVQNDLYGRMTDPVPYDEMTRHSIVTIIPGYLSKILKVTRDILTGGDSDLEIYSAEKETFTTAKAEASDIKKKMFKGAADEMSKAIAIVKSIDPKNELSESERKLLAQQISKDSNAGKSFNIKNYATAAIEGDDNLVINDFVKKRYSLTTDEMESDNPFATQRLGEVNANLSSAYKNAGGGYGTIDKTIGDLSASGNKDIARLLGITKLDAEGRTVIDHDKKREAFYAAGYSNDNLDQLNTEQLASSDIGRNRLRILSGDEAISDDNITKRNEAYISKVQASRDKADEPIEEGFFKRAGKRVNSVFLGDEVTAAPTINRGSSITDISSSFISRKGKKDISSSKGLPVHVMTFPDKCCDFISNKLNVIAKASSSTKPDNSSPNSVMEDMASKTVELLKDGFNGVFNRLDSGVETKGGSGGMHITASGLVKAPFKLGFGAGKKMLGMLPGYYKGLGKLAGGAYDKAKDLGAGGVNMVGALMGTTKQILDLKIPGAENIIIEAKKIMAGDYIDSLTGKVISSIEDITGEVLDKKGNVVLSAEDFSKGLVDGLGKKVNFNGLTSNFRKAIDSAAGLGKGLLDKGMSIFSGGTSLLATGIKWAGNKINEEMDIYLPGEKIARLSVSVMKRGGYVTDKGTVVSSFADIDGDVYAVSDTEQTSAILTMEEVKDKGIVNRWGSAIENAPWVDKVKSLVSVGAGFVGKGIGLAKKFNSKMMESLGSAFDSSMEWFNSSSGGFDINSITGAFSYSTERANGILTSIFEFMQSRWGPIDNVTIPVDDRGTPEEFAEKMKGGIHAMVSNSKESLSELADKASEYMPDSIKDKYDAVKNFSAKDALANARGEHKEAFANYLADKGLDYDSLSKIEMVKEYAKFAKDGKLGTTAAKNKASSLMGKAKDAIPNPLKMFIRNKAESLNNVSEERKEAFQSYLNDKGLAYNTMDMRTRVKEFAKFIKDSPQVTSASEASSGMMGRLKNRFTKTAKPLTALTSNVANSKDSISSVSDYLKVDGEIDLNNPKEASNSTVKDYLAGIFKRLKPEKEEKVLGDADGDGLREGGWKAMLKRKNAKKNKDGSAAGVSEKDLEAADKEGGTNFGMWGALLTGAVGLVTSKLSWLKDGIGSVFKGGFGMLKDSIVGMGSVIKNSVMGIAGKIKDSLGGLMDKFSSGGADIDLDADGDDKDKKKKGKKRGGKKRGLFGKMFDKVKGAGKMIAGSKLGKMAGTVGGFVGRNSMSLLKGGATVLRGAAMLATGPIGLAITAGTLAYQGYHMYQDAKDERSPAPLDMIRFAQYGIDVNNSEHLRAIRRLEEMFSDNIKWVGGGAELGVELSHFLDDDILEDEFKLDTSSQEMLDNWTMWFTQRFYPIAMANLTTANGMFNAKELNNISNKITKEQVPEFLKKAVQYGKGGSNPMNNSWSPFDGETFFDTTEEVRQRVSALLADLPQTVIKDASMTERATKYVSEAAGTVAGAVGITTAANGNKLSDPSKVVDFNAYKKAATIAGTTTAIAAGAVIAGDASTSETSTPINTEETGTTNATSTESMAIADRKKAKSQMEEVLMATPTTPQQHRTPKQALNMDAAVITEMNKATEASLFAITQRNTSINIQKEMLSKLGDIHSATLSNQGVNSQEIAKVEQMSDRTVNSFNAPVAPRHLTLPSSSRKKYIN